MKTITTLLTALALCTATIAWAGDIVIPTDDGHPFDLTQGILEGSGLSINGANEIDNGRNGYKATFTLQNIEDVDFYLLTFKAGTTRNDAQFHITITAQDGSVACNKYVNLTNNGTWTPNVAYSVKTSKMKKGRYTLVFDFISEGNNYVARLADIAFKKPIFIPTTDENPFDLTLGIFEGSGMKINSANEIDNGRNGYKATFTLQNIEDADFYLLTFKAGTTRNDAQFHITITAQDGSVACDTCLALTNNGTWTANVIYSMKTGMMKKGHYTLVFNFITEGNNYVARLADIAFKKPMKLKPGDNVPIENPEFDADLSGWTRDYFNGGVSKEMFGNCCATLSSNSNNTSTLSQTVTGLPDGIYLFKGNAYDQAGDWDGTAQLQTFLFLNSNYQPMKNAYDDAVGYRNIYRVFDGQSLNDKYRRTEDGRWLPATYHEWNECLAMAEGLYDNGIVAVITNGKATFGLTKTDTRRPRIICDHFCLIYLSEETNLRAYAHQLRVKTMSRLAKDALNTALNASDALHNGTLASAIGCAESSVRLFERLEETEQSVRQELSAKRPHSPQAVIEAESIINHQSSVFNSDTAAIDHILHLEHVLQRLQLPFHDIAVSTGTLSNQIEANGLETADVMSLRLTGTLNDDDFNTLKTFTNLMELDLSAISNMELPDNLFGDASTIDIYNNKLTWVTLPARLERIGHSVFYKCYSLRNMELPTTLKTVGSYAFTRCYSLDYISLPDVVTWERNSSNGGQAAFSNSGVRWVVLPPSMKSVPNTLFSGCNELRHVTFNGQSRIETNAFSNTDLRELVLPEGVTRIDNNAFAGCQSLTSVTLPSSIAITYKTPFDQCKKLQTVTLKALAPPYGGIFNTNSMSGEGRTLRVPRFSVEIYRESIWAWNQWNIEPIEELPQTINLNGVFTFEVPDDLPADYKPNITLDMITENITYAPFGRGSMVDKLLSKAGMTVNGKTMFSTGLYKQLYSPYAARTYQIRHSGSRIDLGTSLIINGQMRADQLTADLRLYTDCWEFVSFPFDVRVADIVVADGPVPFVIYGYDAEKRAEGAGGETWVKMTSDSTLHAGQGYIWRTFFPKAENSSEQRSYNQFLVSAVQNANKPKFFRNSDVEVTLAKHNAEFPQNRSWNFIGNPYPCFFDIRAMETTAPIIVWEYSGTSGNYHAYSPLDDDYVLFPGEPFFIQRPLDQSNLVFHKEGRQHDLELRYVASSNLARAVSAQPRQVFNLKLSADETDKTTDEADGNSMSALDGTRFVINEAASIDYEPGRDASKFTSLDDNVAQLYTINDGVRYAIDERPFADGIIRLGMRLPAAGEYTISLGQVKQFPSHHGEEVEAVILLDHETGTETDLTAAPYTFTATAGICNSRFTIHLGTATTVPYVALPTQQAAHLYDLQGRRVSNPHPGVYVKNNKKVIIK